MNTKIKQILKEPFLHFLLLGFFIFLISSYISKQRDIHTISIDKTVMEKLVLAWQTQFGKQPTEKDLKIAADDYVKHEVLVREAKLLGLDNDDEIIRRRLEQKMVFLLQNSTGALKFHF